MQINAIVNIKGKFDFHGQKLFAIHLKFLLIPVSDQYNKNCTLA